jgi:disulfide bond formation protein DsbB
MTARSGLTWFALLVALIAVAGSLYLTLGMELEPCPLCFYQRAFAMAVLGVLLVGLLSGVNHIVSISRFALPLAAAGGGIAGFHVYLEATGALECPKGVFQVTSASQESLIVYAVLFLVLFIDVVRAPQHAGGHWVAALGGLILGGLFAWGCLKSTPPSPKPKEPYDPNVPIKRCRVPYKS